MWIIDRLRGEQRDLTFQQVWGHDRDWEGWERSASGATVTVESAMRVAVYWRCINLLMDDVSTQPVDVVDSDGSYRKRLTKPIWMRFPDPNDRNITFRRHLAQAVFSELTDGNIFTEAFPSTLPNEVMSIRARDPKKVEVRRDPANGEVQFVEQGLVQTWREMVHIPLVVPPGKDRGLNPIDAAREGLGTGLSSQEWSSSYFANGAALSGVIEHPGNPTDDETAKMREGFKHRHVGRRKNHSFGILTGGAKWVQLSASPKDSMLIELWEWIVEDTARYFGVPPFKVGSTKPGAVAYASTSSARIEYAQGPVLALTRKIEDGYSRLLPDGQAMRIDLNGLMRGDVEARFRAYGVGLDKKVYTRDEVRAWEDLSPADEASGLGSENGGFLESPNNNAPGAAPVAAGGTDA